MIGRGEHGDVIVWLGEGDVVVSTAHQKDRPDNEVVFASSESGPHPIGETLEHLRGASTSTMQNVVRLQFTRSESVDVVIEALQAVKAAMTVAS